MAVSISVALIWWIYFELKIAFLPNTAGLPVTH
jgi:hypothetical protein